MPETSGSPFLSVVVPLYNEEDSVAALVAAVREAVADGWNWELVLVDDGSWDRTAEVAEAICRTDPRVRLLRLAWNYGQTPAMQAGFDHARGEVVVSMDGDLQNDPRDIPALVAKLQEGYDLVAGYRLHRKDSLLSRRVPSWLANRLIRSITGVSIRDNGCSLKAYRRDLLDRLHLYSDMHRFIPAVAAATAGARIAEFPVRHHARRFGTSKYGLSRVGKVLADLLVIKMMSTFRERPLSMFALGASVAALIGLLFGGSMLVSVAASLFQLDPGFAAVDGFVLPGVTLLWFGLAFFLLMLGLISEVMLREFSHSRARTLAVLREEISG
jgi:glycosyltransferase involved in cell wall biosynthesis